MLLNWLKVSLLLCIFGFFREMRPSEPFATEFFMRYRNVTQDEITQYVFPMGTYSYMFQLVVVFLITDALRYKPIIVVSAILGICIFSALLWIDDWIGIAIAQISYGAFMACEVAYYTYIYAKVERNKYQQVTGHTRSAFLAGRFVGSVIAQLLVSLSLMNYRQLNYLSLASSCFSLIWALLLPSVGVSLYFYSDKPSNENSKDVEKKSVPENIGNAVSEAEIGTIKTNASVSTFSCSGAARLLWEHLSISYSNLIVIQWSIWWAIAMCGFLQVQSYIQVLWKETDAMEENLFNGAVEAALTLLGAIGAFAAGLLDSKRFNRFDIWILTALTTCEGVLLLWGARTQSLYVSYVVYVLFGMIYHFMITVASATVAKKLHEDCFALIFGINTLMALVLQSLLTFITITVLNLNVRTQYECYAYFFFSLAVIYSIVGLLNCTSRRNR